MVIDRRLLILPALAALAAHNADAFTPANFGARTASNSVRFSMVAESDVSVEYDSAARLAYKEWCAKFGKESSDARFETFKANYEAITVANVSAAKKARDGGTDRPKDMELNEFGDMSEKEYLEMQAGGSGGAAAAEAPAQPRKGALDSVMEASMAQSDASSALAEAADAMAEEEEQLAEALGLDSIDELEAAIDAAQGIDSEGVQIDTSDVREARVRAAYFDWCKEYGKTPDDARFPTFSSNFLAMEEYANENGREMVLNKYADCTEEEYRQLTNTSAPAPELVVEKIVEKEPVAPKKEEPKAEAPKKEEPKVEAKVEKPKPAPKAPPAPKPAPVKELSLEEEAIKLATAAREAEAAQIARRRELDEQAAQMEREKAAAALKKQQQAVVPTPPKSKPVESKEEGNIFSSLFQSAPKKAAPSAPKKETPAAAKKDEPAVDDKAAAQARLKAAGAVVAKQRNAEMKAIKSANAPPKKDEGAGLLGSLFGSAGKAPEKPAAPVKPTPPEPVKAEKKVEASNPFSFLQPAAEKPKAKAASEPLKLSTPPKKPEIEMAPNAMTEALNSFFGTSSKTPAPAAPSKPEPVVEPPKPKPQPFNLFGGSAPAVAKKVEAPPAPKPAPVRKPSPTLSLFGGAAPKPAPKAPPAPVSEPAPKGSGTFSLFSSPPPAVKKVEPTPTPVAKKPAPAFGGFFGGAAPKPAPKVPEPTPVVKAAPVKGSGTFSLFGGAPPATPKPVVAQKAPVVKKAPVKKATPNGVAGIGGFGTFGAPKKTVKQPARAAGTISVTQARGPGTISISSPKKTPPAPVAKKSPAKGSGTFSLFGGSSPAPTPAPEPVKAKTPASGSGTFSIFGGGGAKKKETPAPEPVKPKAIAKPAGGFFGGAKKEAPKVVDDGIPIVSKFTQNNDGSITGIVRNSKSFKNGTEITTSPVKRGAKSGDVVTTSSGSKYRLE